MRFVVRMVKQGPHTDPDRRSEDDLQILYDGLFVKGDVISAVHKAQSSAHAPTRICAAV